MVAAVTPLYAEVTLQIIHVLISELRRGWNISYTFYDVLFFISALSSVVFDRKRPSLTTGDHAYSCRQFTCVSLGIMGEE